MTYTLAESELSKKVASVAFYKFPAQDASMLVVAFIQDIFIPNHIIRKSLSGRTHYQAILKHILRPETVQTLFAQYSKTVQPRLKSVPGWPYLDDLRLCDLNADHVQRLIASAVAHGYSTQTVKHIKNVLGTIISHAKKERIYHGDNPAAEVKLPSLVHSTPRALTLTEARAILRMLKHPERELALLSMCTGMGVSEICGLKWKHVNMSRSTRFVEGQAIPPHGILFRRHRTRNDGVNVIPDRPRVMVVPESLMRMLDRLNHQQGITDPDGFVIAARLGHPNLPMNAQAHRLKPIGRKLHMPWLSWQVLKRAHGVFLSEMSVQLTDDLVRNAQYS